MPKKKAVAEMEAKGYKVLNSFFKEEFQNQDDLIEIGVKNVPISFLAKSLVKMSMCDAVCFVKGWECARGCKIEHEVARQYGLEIFYTG